MKIFLNSALHNADYDYSWYIVENGLVSRMQDSPEKAFLELLNLDKKSIAFGRSNEKWCFGLTGLGSTFRKRIDFGGRKIRNSILLVAEKEVEAETLRVVAIKALQGFEELEEILDKAFEEIPGNEPKIEFHKDEFDRIFNKNHLSPSQVSILESSTGRVFPANNENLTRIAQDLEGCKIEKFNYPILVYRAFEEKEFFKKKRVWRGISELEDSISSYPIRFRILSRRFVGSLLASILAIFFLSNLLLIYFFFSKPPEMSLNRGMVAFYGRVFSLLGRMALGKINSVENIKVILDLSNSWDNNEKEKVTSSIKTKVDLIESGDE